MARKVKAFQTKDGKVFTDSYAAQRHERRVIFRETIKKLDVNEDVKEYLQNNWDEVKNLTNRFRNMDDPNKIEEEKVVA